MDVRSHRHHHPSTRGRIRRRGWTQCTRIATTSLLIHSLALIQGVEGVSNTWQVFRAAPRRDSGGGGGSWPRLMRDAFIVPMIPSHGSPMNVASWSQVRQVCVWVLPL